jgi:hypothetical protein
MQDAVIVPRLRVTSLLLMQRTHGSRVFLQVYSVDVAITTRLSDRNLDDVAAFVEVHKLW